MTLILTAARMRYVRILVTGNTVLVGRKIGWWVKLISTGRPGLPNINLLMPCLADGGMCRQWPRRLDESLR
ncbi:hypothetical protein [Micromonospora chokoriensis]|uniref:hypothetical protein n=1 Tax=Micromonospora chokoriensis TaxID=356851 RepID=UPI000AC203BE|nr:hypothetical protein [Micromonospora chokoriensis]